MRKCAKNSWRCKVKKTENFNLNLPELNDNYNVEDSNSNMSIIDAELKIQSEEIDEAQAEIEEVQEEIGGMQGEVASMRTEISSAQTGIASAQAKADSTQAEVEKIKSDIVKLNNSQSLDGVNIDFKLPLFSNKDTSITLTGYIRGKEAHLSVSGWVGSDTAKNNTHIPLLRDDDAEYAKLFEQFNIPVSVPYSASVGGFRQATVSLFVGTVVTEYEFTHKTTGAKVNTYNIMEYIDNTSYDWTGTIQHNGLELFFQGLPDISMANYPICINASTSCIWEGK